MPDESRQAIARSFALHFLQKPSDNYQPIGAEQVLSALQQAHRSQRNQIIRREAAMPLFALISVKAASLVRTYSQVAVDSVFANSLFFHITVPI